MYSVRTSLEDGQTTLKTLIPWFCLPSGYVKHFHKAETKMFLVHCPETYANVTMMSKLIGSQCDFDE